MSKHTPGLWIAKETEDGAEIVALNNGAQVAQCVENSGKGTGNWYHITLKEARFNARVMATAPKLLAALKKAINFLPSDHGMPTPLFEECFEAIHEAEEEIMSEHMQRAVKEAKKTLAKLRAIQEAEEGPLSMPWPEIQTLEETIRRVEEE